MLQKKYDEWGLTAETYAIMDRLQNVRRARENRATYQRERNERGRYVAGDMPEPQKPGKLWPVASFPGLIAYTERKPRSMSFGTSNRELSSLVSIPYVSLQHREA